jgi:hypothetical protein
MCYISCYITPGPRPGPGPGTVEVAAFRRRARPGTLARTRGLRPGTRVLTMKRAYYEMTRSAKDGSDGGPRVPFSSSKPEWASRAGPPLHGAGPPLMNPALRVRPAAHVPSLTGPAHLSPTGPARRSWTQTHGAGPPCLTLSRAAFNYRGMFNFKPHGHGVGLLSLMHTSCPQTHGACPLLPHRAGIAYS